MSLRLPVEEYRALRQKVWDRDGWKCRRCGLRESLHAHHVIFRSEGGRDETWNLLTLCQSCHDQIHCYKLFVEVVPPNFVGEGGGCDKEVRFTYENT